MAETKKATASKAKKTTTSTAAKKEAEVNVQELLAAMKQQQETIAQLQKELSEKQAPQVIQISNDTEKVTFLWQADVADENVFKIGQNAMFGRVTGKTGTFQIPKSELSRAMDSMFTDMLRKRWIICVSGLSDDERRIYGVDYKDGEIIDRGAFSRLANMGNELLPIYGKLCDSHKEIVAKRLYEAYMDGTGDITRDLIVSLKNMSNDCKDAAECFQRVIEAMNSADAK